MNKYMHFGLVKMQFLLFNLHWWVGCYFAFQTPLISRVQQLNKYFYLTIFGGGGGVVANQGLCRFVNVASCILSNKSKISFPLCRLIFMPDSSQEGNLCAHTHTDSIVYVCVKNKSSPKDMGRFYQASFLLVTWPSQLGFLLGNLSPISQLEQLKVRLEVLPLKH